MAVEIPVFVDIDKALKDAAERIPSAIKPLQSFLDSDSNALAIKLKIDDKNKVALKNILEDATMSAKNFKTALADAYSWLENAAKSGGLDLTKGIKESEKIHLQALGALEYKINGVNDASKMMSVVYSANIERAKTKVSELMLRIDDLTKKQNKYNILSKKNAPGAKLNYANVTKQIAAANADLNSAKILLNSFEVELDKISAGGVKAAASVSMIKTPAMQMAEEFRRGSAYVERWNAALGSANSRMGLLLKSSLSLVALHAGTSFIRNVREVTSEFEMQRVALGGIIQDTDRAEKLFKQIKAAAIQSPFEIKDLVSFTKQLSAYRIETENLFDVTMRLADISAGLGVDMSRLVLAYGQVRAASVLRGQELRQFTEAGIPLVDELAKKFSDLNGRMVSTAEVFDLISKRAVPFRMIEEIFEDMTNAGGIFYRMQEKQSETLKGQWMKLRDALSIMYDEIGNTQVVHGAMEALLKNAMDLLQNWREVGKTLGTIVSAMVAYKFAVANARIAANALTAAEVAEISALELNTVGRSKLIAAIFGETAATKAQIFMGNLYVRMKEREMMATNMFTKALYRMIAAMLKNPYALAIAGVTALVAVIVRLIKSSKEATITIDEFQKSIDSFGKTSDYISEIDSLCDAYEELSKKTVRTKEEQDKLDRVTRELAKAYPSAVSGVNAYGNAIEINTQKVRELTKNEEKLLRTILERQKRQAEDELDRLRARREEINNIISAGGYQVVGGTDIAPEIEFHELSEEELQKLGTELGGLIEKINEFTEKMADADDKLEGMADQPLGPPLPDFFGDAWRTNINSYITLLKSSNTESKAFTKDQIEQFTNAKEALDATAKSYQTQAELVDFYTAAMQRATGAIRDQISAQRDDAISMRDMYAQILTDYNAWDLIKEKSGRVAHQTDPWITNMQDRIKFMQDFKKGYDDLKKYISSSSALAEEAGIMLGRGASLGLSAADQQRAAENLSGWYEDMIKATSARLRGKGLAGATVTDLLGIDTTKRSKDIQELQKLLQSLWDAKTDFDVSQKKKDFEDALQRLSDEIKRSETARDFYKNILDLTGDEELAATMGVSVYGDIGSEFKDRLQKQLNSALSAFDDKGDFALWDKMREALGSGDFNTILKYLDRFPEEWQKRLKQMSEDDEKYNADLVQNLMKTLAKSKTYGDKQVEIAKKSAERIAEINALAVPQTVKDDLLKQNAKKEAEETARVQYEAFKESPMYIELFENLEGASTRMLTNMRENLHSLKGEWKNLSPRELRELQNKLDELDKQLATRNPFRAMVDSWKEYIELTKQQSRADADETAAGLTRYANLQKELLEAAKKNYEAVKNKKDATAEDIAAAKDELDVQAEETDLAIEQAEAAQEMANKYRQAAKHIQDAAVGMKEWAGYITDALGGIGEIIETFASDDTADTFNIISEGIGKTLNGLATTAGSVGRLMAGDLTAIPALIQGIGDVVVGIFGTKQKLKIKEIDKQIKYQQDLLDDLSYSYDRLEKAMAKAFGSDYIYNYNKQLENLNAQIEAYNAQADLERGKGKKADADKIKEYENNAREAQDKITEMQSQLSEFFAGTDLTSAAKDFASSWIEAYKEFGSTTDAMKERFQDLIESMVTQSLGAKIMQSILQPLFDEIDALAASGGELTTGEIAKIANEAPMYIGQINDAMTNLMNQLGAAGYNLRQGVGGFTGISRDIAGASEESITGLAAGINTQNFYMSLISQNVAAILAAMTGETVEGATGAAVPDPYKEQVLTYMGSLPQMRDDMYAIRTLLERVIKPIGTNATHYVATRM